MALLYNENTSFSRFQECASNFEHHPPTLLKDFLRDDYFPSSSSSASSSIVLLRSWSKKAAATRISAIHKVINVVKLIQFASAKSPLVLPRSKSRKLPKRDKAKIGISGDHVSEVRVKVKDILRWRSFRDAVEDNTSPLDLPSSPSWTTTTTSWCDSDFTAEELQLWGGKPAGTNVTLRKPKGDWSFEEYEQQSPVSVLDSPFREVEDHSISPFHRTPTNLEKAKCVLTRKIEELEVTPKPKHARELSFGGEIAAFDHKVKSIEKKAKELLSRVEEESKSPDNDNLILDFFMHELSLEGNLNNAKFDYEILRVAKSWVNGECNESYDWDLEDKREFYVKDMEKEACWNKFKKEQQAVTNEFEVKLWHQLIDELLIDFLAK